MNTCTECGKELPSHIDEFGPLDALLCQSCWFLSQAEPMDNPYAGQSLFEGGDE